MVDISNSAWTENDADNNSPAPLGIQIGYPPSSMGGIIRAERGAIKRWYDKINAIYTTTGSATALVITLAVAPAAPVKGERIAFLPHVTTTGTTCTLNINAGGAKSILRSDGTALVAGDIGIGQFTELAYDGTAWRIVNGAGAKFTGNVTASSFTGAFSGDGSALTALNATQLTSGTVPNARLAGAYDFATLTLSDRGYAPIFEAKTTATNPEYRLTVGSTRVASLYSEYNGTENLVLRKYNTSTGAAEGFIRITGNTINSFDYNGSTVWTDANTTTAQINGLIGYVPANSTIAMTAGNGLSGGGTLAAARTFTLGTPSTITNSTTNSVTATSHTHALTLVAGDITGALGFTPPNSTNNFVAGNGLSGGGTLAAGRTFTLGTPSSITATSTNTVSATSHTHDFDFASFVYTGTDANNVNFPIGSTVVYSGSRSNRNSTVALRLGADNSDSYWNNGTGAVLQGTWRARGRSSSGENLAQRVA